MSSSPRQTEYPIDPQFTARWSPRAFTGEAMPQATLMSLFEAARWAPSASNSQPWRFIYGHRGSAGFDAIFGSLVPFNQDWAQRASALVAVVSQAERLSHDGKEMRPQAWHSFDTGCAWGYLALQAQLAGWHAHGMGGFDRAALSAALGVPPGYQVEAVVAIGKLGDPALLPEALREREIPSQRLPLATLVAEGRFSF